jgi:hypothetical protein
MAKRVQTGAEIMLITPQFITKTILIFVCATGVFTFIFKWAMSEQTAIETSLYIGITAAFALASAAPYTAGRILGRIILMVCIGHSVYGPALVGLRDTTPLSAVWPGILLGAIMANPVYLEKAIELVLKAKRLAEGR